MNKPKNEEEAVEFIIYEVNRILALETKLKCVSNYDITQLTELFIQGWTLQPPDRNIIFDCDGLPLESP